jgi:hypothetical protein
MHRFLRRQKWTHDGGNMRVQVYILTVAVVVVTTFLTVS